MSNIPLFPTTDILSSLGSAQGVTPFVTPIPNIQANITPQVPFASLVNPTAVSPISIPNPVASIIHSLRTPDILMQRQLQGETDPLKDSMEMTQALLALKQATTIVSTAIGAIKNLSQMQV